jgi:hypothetical protein
MMKAASAVQSGETSAQESQNISNEDELNHHAYSRDGKLLLKLEAENQREKAVHNDKERG